jgi:hypothetical protein
VPDPLARPLWRGRTNVDAMTIAAIEAAEEIAGFAFTVTQGSYQSSVPQSAGTHDKGGVIDWHTSSLSDRDKVRMIAALREVGWAAWVRHPWQGDWPEHAHGVVIGHPYLADSAARQVEAYRDGLDGLAAGRADYHPRPDPIPTFAWPPEDDMADYADQLDEIQATAEKALAAVAELDEKIEQASKREERRFANLRVILKERFGATDRDLDEIMGAVGS